MSDAEKPELRADLKLLAEKLVTREQAEQLKKLSPEDRAKVLDVVAQIIARDIRKRAVKRQAD